MKRKTLAVLVGLVAAVSVSAQKKVFSWQDFTCEFKGTYDSRKYTSEQIADTRKLVDFGVGLPLQTDQTVFDPKDIETLDVAKLDEEYKTVRNMLMELRPVETEFFSVLKEKNLRTLETSYELKRVTLLAHTDPGVLNEQSSREECFEKWGKPVIAGGTKLLDAWKLLLKEQMERNASPAALEARFNSRFNSDQRDKWALVEVLGFGWWNCVNMSIPYVENDGTVEAEFKKLFIKVETLECDEP